MKHVAAKILSEAARIEGSTQALAYRLNAPESTLLRWMHGWSDPPLRAYLAALEYVMEAERRAEAQHAAFPLDEWVPRCTHCGGTNVRPAQPGGLHLTSRWLCASCGGQMLHGKLLAELGKQAARQPRRRRSSERFPIHTSSKEIS